LAHIFPNDECFENPATLLSTHARGRGFRHWGPNNIYGMPIWISVYLGFEHSVCIFASVQFIPNYMRERPKCAKCRKANIIACLGWVAPKHRMTIAVYIHDFCIIFSTKHGNLNLRHTLFSSFAA